MKLRIYTILLVLLFWSPFLMEAGTVVKLSPDEGNLTLLLRQRIGEAVSDEIHIVLEKGRYDFHPEMALQQYCTITNHGNGLKNILFHLSGKKSVIIEGNGAELVMHGRFFPFLLENCRKVCISGLTVDWDIPFLFQGEVTAVNPEEGWREIRPYREGFSWKMKNGKLSFPESDGFSFHALGSTLAFDKDSCDVAYGAKDIYSTPERVVQRPGGILRIYEKCKYYPPVGSVQVSKGDRGDDRYAPAFGFKSCSKVLLEGVTVHHALGMGFLFERCDGVTLRDCRVCLRPGSSRMVSTTADATHFANCRGQILLEGCTFRNMLDDGCNVHGTYVVVERVTGPRTALVKLMHFEQLGFQAAAPGDELWLIHQPSPQREETVGIESVRTLNEKYMEYRFDRDLPAALKAGDLLENKTWNPDFTMHRCHVSHHRARNVVLKTPGKIVVEDNDFSSMMSSILFRGESFFWYESGAVCDALIMNNRFRNCAAASPANAVMLISPRLGKGFDRECTFDRNIRFIGNVVEGPNPKVVDASRTDALVIRDNVITVTPDARTAFLEKDNFKTSGCSCVIIKDNRINTNR